MATSETPVAKDDKFGWLNLHGKTQQQLRKKKSQARVFEAAQPREEKMPVNQDWTSVWPVARSFHPASVPLPVRQGYTEVAAPPSKYANLELMKIPNFLHLTPPAIEKHCKELSQFCTAWPEGLATEEDITKHFPLELISCDYLHSSPSIRDLRARIVTLRVKLSRLGLDSHALDKLLRLVKDRYDPKSDILTLVADRCPRRHQNRQYVDYLLAALYHESQKFEPWESEKLYEDAEQFEWRNSEMETSVTSLLKGREGCEEEVQQLATTVTKLLNEGEDVVTIREYGDSVRKILNLPAVNNS